MKRPSRTLKTRMDTRFATITSPVCKDRKRPFSHQQWFTTIVSCSCAKANPVDARR